MTNLFDMMMQAQNGNASDTLARQFGLSVEQTEKVMELMMPAFSNGLKRNTADPMALMNFMSALSTGQHQKYHDDPSEAFRDDAINEGNAILGHLFGSKETSRAVAEQVALTSGIGPTILKKMLPVIASMIMGGLFKGGLGGLGGGASTGGMRSGAGGDLLGTLLESFMNGGVQGMGRGHSGAGRQTSGSSSGPSGMSPMDNPFGKMMEDFLGGAMGRQPSAPRNEYRTPERGEDIFGDMFETGRQVQDQYKRNIDSIFDQYLDGMRRS
ncbi:MAG: DUF937 domain-containing protein [Pseudomonadota bacterium]